MPDFFQNMLFIAAAATSDAGWLPHPSQLGIRCTQFLKYNANNEVVLHKDADSIYTMVLMLSSQDKDFVGGDILFQPEGVDESELLRSSPKQFGGIIFDSNVLHGVDTITTGDRKVLVFEFWPYEEPTIGQKRADAEDSILMVPKLQRTNSNLDGSNTDDDSSSYNNSGETKSEESSFERVNSCFLSNYTERTYERNKNFDSSVREPVIIIITIVVFIIFNNIIII